MADIGLDFWLTQWNWEPSIFLGTALITGLYLYAITALRKKYFPAEHVNRAQISAFLVGIFIMFLALVSPLDELGDSYLFSAHMVQHLCLTIIVFGVINWWPIFSPLEEGLPRLSIGGQILYLFLSGMPTVALGAGLTFLPPLYAPYLSAPRIWGISPALDQQLGGLIMWIPGNLFYIIIVSILFIRWMQMQDAQQRSHEAKEYQDAELFKP